MRLLPAAFVVGFVGCHGDYGTADTNSPAVDAGAVVVSTPEAGAPTDASTDAGVPDAGCVMTTATAILDADAELAACNNGSPDGAKTVANLSANGALFRFTFGAEDLSALTAATSILGGTLHLSAKEPATAGAIEVHLARSDWDEGAGAEPYDGCDVCRRTSDQKGLGWGPNAPWGPATFIASPADYEPAPTAVDLADGAVDVAVTIPSVMPSASPAIGQFPSSGKVSFFVNMPKSGSMGVITKEGALGSGAATFSLDYCK